jgi:hypothetical protein
MVLKRRLLGLTLITLLPTSAAFAQLAKPPVAALTVARIGQDAPAPRVIQFNDTDGITVTFVPAPSLASTSGGPATDSGQWMKVEFHYSVNPDKIPFVDSAEFKVWIEGRDLYAANAPGKQGVAVGLTGSVTYVNIPKGRDAYAVVYLHPSALARYNAGNGQDDFDRKFNIHVDALVGGTRVDYFDKRKNDPGGAEWYKALTPVTGMVFVQNQSPFIASDVPRYPQMKLPTPAP